MRVSGFFCALEVVISGQVGWMGGGGGGIVQSRQIPRTWLSVNTNRISVWNVKVVEVSANIR